MACQEFVSRISEKNRSSGRANETRRLWTFKLRSSGKCKQFHRSKCNEKHISTKATPQYYELVGTILLIWLCNHLFVHLLNNIGTHHQRKSGFRKILVI